MLRWPNHMLCGAHDEHQKRIQELQKRIKQRRSAIQKEKREPNAAEQQDLDRWQQDADQLNETMPPGYDVAHALSDSGSEDMSVALRGNLRKPGEVAPRRFLRILAGNNPPHFRVGSGRLELAEAVVDADNRLTTRVFVNRVWLHHFGKALVRTPSNFGVLGEKPTHPNLLDWLAAEFVETGWSIKEMHRTIMTSATYQMCSDYNEESFRVDGDNRFIWRMNLRRLDAEAWRDTLLSITGELDCRIGGPPSDKMDSRRRSLYFKVSRNGDRFASDEFLRLFDFPLMRATVAKRPTSIVPQQYLFMMNSPFMIDRAKALATRLEYETSDEGVTDEETPDERASNVDKRIQSAYRLLYCRLPSPRELGLGREYVNSLGRSENAGLTPWQQYAQVLLSSNELMYVQ